MSEKLTQKELSILTQPVITIMREMAQAKGKVLTRYYSDEKSGDETADFGFEVPYKAKGLSGINTYWISTENGFPHKHSENRCVPRPVTIPPEEFYKAFITWLDLESSKPIRKLDTKVDKGVGMSAVEALNKLQQLLSK